MFSPGNTRDVYDKEREYDHDQIMTPDRDQIMQCQRNFVRVKWNRVFISQKTSHLIRDPGCSKRDLTQEGQHKKRPAFI